MKDMIRLLAGLAVFSVLSLSAQDSLLLHDYRFVKQQDPWLTSLNAAALTRFAQPGIAEAEVATTYGHGRLVNFGGPSDALTVNASVESFFRLSTRAVLFGAMSYDNFSGKDMGGSAFISDNSQFSTLSSQLSTLSSPYSARIRPFDIVEDSLTTAGDKHQDTYRLSGGFGTAVADELSVGARLDFTAANYAKYKDLRHQNKLMDLVATVGVYVPIASWVRLGACYQYHRNVESITFSTYGKSEKVYKSLIDYGAFFGRVEQFGSVGYTDKSREMPLVDESYGGTIQAEVVPLDCLSVFASLSNSSREGYYGRKSPYTITYTSHSGNRSALKVHLTYRSQTARHRLDFCHSTERLSNKANTYRELLSATGAPYYEYYDPAETGDKRWQEGVLAYTAHLLINGDIPTWTIQAGINWTMRRQTAYVFPCFRYQKLTSHKLFAGLAHSLFQKSGIWTLSLCGSLQDGTGQPYTDGTLDASTESAALAPVMEAYLMQEYHYLTSAQYSIGGSAKYAFIFPGTSLKTHFRLAFDYRKATESSAYCGNHRATACIAIGCTF